MMSGSCRHLPLHSLCLLGVRVPWALAGEALRRQLTAMPGRASVQAAPRKRQLAASVSPSDSGGSACWGEPGCWPSTAFSGPLQSALSGPRECWGCRRLWVLVPVLLCWAWCLYRPAHGALAWGPATLTQAAPSPHAVAVQVQCSASAISTLGSCGPVSAGPTSPFLG